MMKGDAPPKHFESLGRTCVRAGGHNALVSWSGAMLEYFMPHRAYGRAARLAAL